jgi:hypothetical protein
MRRTCQEPFVVNHRPAFYSIMVISNFLQLARVSLLARFTNNPDSVYSDSFSFSLTIHDEKYQACDILELDET